MNSYEDKIKEFQLIQKAQLNSTIKGTKEHFIKSIVEELIEDGFSGDELLVKAKEKLSGGRWVTINGNHVYIKDGKVEAGAVYTGSDKNPKVTPGEKVKKEDSKSGSKVSDMEKKVPGYMKMPQFQKWQKAKDRVDNWGKVTSENKRGYDQAESDQVAAFKEYKEALKNKLQENSGKENYLAKTKEEKIKELVSRLKGKSPKDKTPEAIRDIKKQLSELKAQPEEKEVGTKIKESLKSKIQSVPPLGTYSYNKNDLKKVKPEMWKDVWGRWDKTSNMIDGINLFGKMEISESGNETLLIPEAKRGVYKQDGEYWFFHENSNGTRNAEGLVSSGKFKEALDKIFERERK